MVVIVDRHEVIVDDSTSWSNYLTIRVSVDHMLSQVSPSLTNRLRDILCRYQSLHICAGGLVHENLVCTVVSACELSREYTNGTSIRSKTMIVVGASSLVMMGHNYMSVLLSQTPPS